ncbi:extracellular solute-binding protein [Paenibacillus terrigena]|uniref:extracellular solute-binding protein n=1 Tax=Paenibacillus terrigena TaxID=369333 RepID=UPI00035D0B19|nr:extracellular solute-binding protein [Paenibacillus terrigena]
MKLKNAMVLLLSLTITASFTACSGSKEGSSAEGSSNGGQSDKPITITLFDGTWENPVPEPKGPAVDAINKRFNVDLQTQYIPFDSYDEKVAVRMASGDIPDVIGAESVDANFVKWAKQGAYLPLNDFIKDYPNLNAIPASDWDSLKIDGTIYGIPDYFSGKGGKKPVIRKDWLDKLGLAMPTNYEELKAVALAFTKNDPDGNGKADTLGLGLAKGFAYDPSFGAYWSSSAWYHKNDQGQLIPGNIAQGNKEKVQFLSELYQAGAISKDWAITTYKDVFKDFNAGKVGIWYEQPGNSGNNGLDFDVLRQNAPEAVVVPIPAFKQSDGQQGIPSGPAWYRMYMISAKLKDQPEKVKKILEMLNEFKTVVPEDKRNPQNEWIDWLNGHEGTGYTMKDGVVQPDLNQRSKVAPAAYIMNQGWVTDDSDLEVFVKIAATPEGKAFNRAMTDYLKSSKFYVNPVKRIISTSYMEKNTELSQYISDETTKMVVGQRPISDWDKMVEEYMSKGGKEVIDQVNDEMKKNNIQGEWK